MTYARKNAAWLLTATLLFGFVLGVGASRVGAAMKGSAVFPDVPSGAYYDDAVGEMNGLGIIQGYQDGRFGPNDYVTRGQVAVLMQRLRNEMKGISTGGSSSSRSSSSSSSSRTSSSSSSSTSSSVSSNSSISAGPEGALQFNTDEIDIVESAKNLSVSVKRINGTKGAVTVKYTLTGSTAKVNEDFSGTTGTVSFADGETQKIITVTLVNDKVGEINEKFKIVLSAPTGGAVLGNPSTVEVTILDNDGGAPGGSSGGSSSSSTAGVAALEGFAFGASEYSVDEDMGSITITVKRLGSTSAGASVDYATSNGTASTEHYNATNGTLNFSSGESSKTFTVTVLDKAGITGNKTVNLTLSNPSGGAMASPSSAIIMIVDDDMSSYTSGTGAIRFDKSSVTVTESVGNAAITVSRINGSNGTVSVNYATTGGSAVAGQDYTATSGTLTFAPGETKKVFFVPVMDDDVPSETEEIVNISLSGLSSGASFSDPTTMQLKINE